MKPEDKRPVTVENLLQLKRAERPGEEFWTEFDRQLRTKQLSALVGKRPWWQELSVSWMFSGLRRYHIPLGVTAVAAFTFSAYRSEVSQTSSEVRPMLSAGLDQANGMVEASMVKRTEEKAAELGARRAEDTGKSVAVDDVTPPLAPVQETATQGVYLASNAFAGGSSDEPMFASMVTAAPSLEPRWGASAVADPVISNTLLSAQTRFEVRATPSRAPAIEPLHQITPPSERRGARILTAMVSMASVESAMRTTERAASRLSHEELYDQIQRFGARGAGVNVKF